MHYIDYHLTEIEWIYRRAMPLDSVLALAFMALAFTLTLTIIRISKGSLSLTYVRDRQALQLKL